MKFTANIDKKYSVWQNITIEFEAADDNEASMLLAKWDGIPQDREIEYLNTEVVFESEEALTKEDNDGQSVFEVKHLTSSDLVDKI